MVGSFRTSSDCFVQQVLVMDEDVDPSVLDMVDLVGRGVRVRAPETLAVDLDEANPQEPVPNFSGDVRLAARRRSRSPWSVR